VIESTGTDATLFSNRAGTTSLSNPFFADSEGFAQFYTEPGAYRITATASGGGTTRTWRYVSLFDFDANVGTAAGEVPLNSTLVPKAGGTFTGDIAAPKITASTGILFGTDTAAANTLDDYEEGTWTPITSFQTNMSSLSITGSEYTTIGNMVFAQLKGSFSVTSASSVRTFFAFTLPFNTENDSTVTGGGGRLRSSSNLEINPAIGDPDSGNPTQAFLRLYLMKQAIMILKLLLCIAKLNCENLQGKNVSGFHVETNLQVITATENRHKSNKFNHA
jgi:hypothetical protein